MKASNASLRLGRLPKIDNIKITFTCSSALKDDLDRYAELHARIHGDQVDCGMLIPHMLAAFMGRDRGFKQGLRQQLPQRGTPSGEGDAS
jgi:hypothetical protein